MERVLEWLSIMDWRMNQGLKWTCWCQKYRYIVIPSSERYWYRKSL
jgi:hypothetical protein